MDPTSESQCHRLLALLSRERLARLLQFTLDDKEFLSPFGIRSLSQYHNENPLQTKCMVPSKEAEVKEEIVWYEARYNPQESAVNTNSQGPVWLGCKYIH